MTCENPGLITTSIISNRSISMFKTQYWFVWSQLKTTPPPPPPPPPPTPTTKFGTIYVIIEPFITSSTETMHTFSWSDWHPRCFVAEIAQRPQKFTIVSSNLRSSDNIYRLFYKCRTVLFRNQMFQTLRSDSVLQSSTRWDFQRLVWAACLTTVMKSLTHWGLMTHVGLT